MQNIAPIILCMWIHAQLAHFEEDPFDSKLIYRGFML